MISPRVVMQVLIDTNVPILALFWAVKVSSVVPSIPICFSYTESSQRSHGEHKIRAVPTGYQF